MARTRTGRPRPQCGLEMKRTTCSKGRTNVRVILAAPFLAMCVCVCVCVCVSWWGGHDSVGLIAAAPGRAQ